MEDATRCQADRLICRGRGPDFEASSQRYGSHAVATVGAEDLQQCEGSEGGLRWTGGTKKMRSLSTDSMKNVVFSLWW